MEIVIIITTLMAKNVYEQDDHYQSGAKKWSGFGLTNRSGSAGPVTSVQNRGAVIEVLKEGMLELLLFRKLQNLRATDTV